MNNDSNINSVNFYFCKLLENEVKEFSDYWKFLYCIKPCFEYHCKENKHGKYNIYQSYNKQQKTVRVEYIGYMICTNETKGINIDVIELYYKILRKAFHLVAYKNIYYNQLCGINSTIKLVKHYSIEPFVKNAVETVNKNMNTTDENRQNKVINLLTERLKTFSSECSILKDCIDYFLKS
jgi:hypothetical protein